MSRRCFVCGFRSDEAVCPRCNTVLAVDRAVCPVCGKAFDGWIATCDTCGAPVNLERPRREDREAVRALASVPGITEARAADLVAKGFRDFADVVRLALPPSAVRQGLHYAIARKVMVADIAPRRERPETGARCPMCGAAWPADSSRCSACGSAFDLELSTVLVDQKLQEITGEIVDLALDKDFQAMPEDVRNDLVQAFGGASPEDLLREEGRRQIEAWRTKGFDVAPIERLLEEDLEHFGERSIRLIRAQVMKNGESGKYRCPLCEVQLESSAAECGNCGARFG